MKKNILEYNYEMPETSGIYEILNKVNRKGYIGQAEYLPDRAILLDHEHNEALQRAYSKYGIENFTVVLLEVCDIDSLDDKEIYWIRKLNTYIHAKESRGYNMTLGGRGTRGYIFTDDVREKISMKIKGENHPWYGRHHSEESKMKISESRKKYVGKNHPLYGKSPSAETREKISQSNTGKTHSEETRRKMSESHRGKRGIQYNLVCRACLSPFIGTSSKQRKCLSCK